MKQDSSKRKGQKSLEEMMEGAFFAMHPYPIIFFDTDAYYNGIAKKVQPMLHPLRKQLHVENPVIMRISLSIAAYLEDQCSKLGLWAAFIHRHKELYGKWLPWYDTSEDYYDDEVNLQDVKFIIWMNLVSTEGDPVINPEHEAIQKCAECIFALLTEEFEVAPENKDLVDYIYAHMMSQDFYAMKNILRWMTTTCYLMCVPTWEMEEREQIRRSLMSLTDGSMDRDMIQYFETSYECLTQRVGPLALYPKDWYVLMRKQRGLTEDNQDILDIKNTLFYPFMVVSRNEDTVTLRSCRDKEYKVDIDSFNDVTAENFNPGDILLTSLVCYKGHWMANGLTTFYNTKESTKKAEEVLKEMAEKLRSGGWPIDFFNTRDPQARPRKDSPAIPKVDEAVAQNNGDRIFYFQNIREAIKWQSAIIGNKMANSEEFIQGFAQIPMMVYVTPEHMMYFMAQVQNVDDPMNPFYDPSLAYTGINWLYDKYECQDDFVAYLIEKHYLTDLSFNPDKPEEKYSQLIEDNLPFFATFLRQYPC